MQFQFDSFSAFIAMGGYGFYVWSALFVTFAALGAVALEVFLRRAKLSKEVTAYRARAERVLAARQRSPEQKSSAQQKTGSAETSAATEFKATEESDHHEPKT
ncbi:heme exporter protein CcmD [Aliidiomarina celeris]|uniref:heme exporter protein CcmD n=1 Tax=Aliidiomarina celeris TaxID=2249428 RepID=UPI000DEB9B32|nr:heme exporter protein CcmD [Aliidiomarina celeris]